MNVLFINPTHPDTQHIAAVRAWRFALELARSGNRVVFLTKQFGDTSADVSLTALDLHTWETPFILICADASYGPRGDASDLPKLLRKAVTAWRMLRDGGEQGAWVTRANHAALAVSDRFRPDVIWTTFGKMESLFVARRLAKGFGCPWILDVKDNWELYVPFGLRHLMTWRTRGAFAVTSNAEFTARMTEKWQHRSSTLIYSGVDDAFLVDSVDYIHTRSFKINLIGGLYSLEALEVILNGIGKWHAKLSVDERTRIQLHYLGGDTALFKRTTERLLPCVQTQNLGYRPIEEFASLCRTASVNCYIGHQRGFHHKFLEMLACNRPILVCPREIEEARQLAETNNLQHLMFEAGSSDEVAKRLEMLFKKGEDDDVPLGDGHSRLSQYSWAQQTKLLEDVMLSAVEVLR